MPEFRGVTKECAQCGTEFTRPPSLGHLTCCSRQCSDEYARRFRLHKTCPVCDSEFTCAPSSSKTYCSNQCRGKVGGRKRGPRIAKTCPICGHGFEVAPSQDHVKTCSVACGHKLRTKNGAPLSPEGRARLVGRPKTSKDTERACPMCGTRFTLPEWNPKVYCSRKCEFASRVGRPVPRGEAGVLVSRKIDKACGYCGKTFQVYPSQSHVECCSRSCSASLGAQRAAAEVRMMSDGEQGWFAGLLDGEGSIVLKQRARVGGGSVSMFITNTVRPLLDRVAEVTGVGKIEYKAVSEKNPKHADCYTWVCGGAQAREILRQVRPWLIVKAERADAVLEGRVFPRQSRWDDIYPESLPR